MSITDAFDAELAYRRERVTAHFRPWRRVGTERTTARPGPVDRSGRSDRSGTGRRHRAAASSVIPASR